MAQTLVVNLGLPAGNGNGNQVDISRFASWTIWIPFGGIYNVTMYYSYVDSAPVGDASYITDSTGGPNNALSSSTYGVARSAYATVTNYSSGTPTAVLVGLLSSSDI